jgi:phage baseplate assembly protein V
MNARDHMAGIALAVVQDRDDQGRVKLNYPWLDASMLSDWVPVMGPMAGGGRGIFHMPEIGDEVVVAFQLGNFEHPVVLGGLWNGVDKPAAEDPRLRTIRSKNGHVIQLVDSTPAGGDQGAIIIRDAHGNTVTLSNGKIAITGTALLELRAPIVTINGRVVQPGPNPI